MKLNGKDFNLDLSVTLTEFLEKQGYKINRVAVELNDEIIPKSTYNEVMVKNEDVIEVVTFMGGGCK